MREMFVSELVYVSQHGRLYVDGHGLSGLMVKTPVLKTGDLRFKFRIRHNFFSQYMGDSPVELSEELVT